jgi:hypothetical protein
MPFLGENQTGSIFTEDGRVLMNWPAFLTEIVQAIDYERKEFSEEVDVIGGNTVETR